MTPEADWAIASPTVALAATWILTYLVHTTVLWLAAAVAARRLRRPADEELLWRSTWLAGLLTATLQLALGIGLPSTAPGLEIPSLEIPAPTLWTVPVSAAPASPSANSTPPASVSWASISGASASPATLAVWAFAALATYFWLRPPIAWWRFQRRLRNRRVLGAGAGRRLLDELVREAGLQRSVVLSVSPEVSVPFAFGLRRPEICLPEQALERLGEEELKSLLAHELAHLVRRDPHWRFLTVWLEDLFFFQPLHRATGRRLGLLAEYLSDDWARRRTGPHPMARCLASVAHWLPRSAPRSVAACPVQGPGGDLAERIRRLGQESRSNGRSRPRLALAAGVLILALPVTVLMPGFSVAQAGSSEGPVVVSPPRDPGEGPSEDLEPPSAEEHGVSCDNPLRLVYMRPIRFPLGAKDFFLDDVTVETKLTIDEYGTVLTIENEHIDPRALGFYEAVKRSFETAVFEPCLKDGQPVKVELVQHFNFRWNRGAVKLWIRGSWKEVEEPVTDGPIG